MFFKKMPYVGWILGFKSPIAEFSGPHNLPETLYGNKLKEITKSKQFQKQNKMFVNIG